MILFPAIDLYRGDVVRLYQGDYERMTVYGHDPAATALTMVSHGATHLHVVDLEGARAGTPLNLDSLRAIRKVTDAFIQAGGGVREQKDVADYLDAGASRVIVGTMAVRDRVFLATIAREFPGKLAVSADLKSGRVMVRGWSESTGMTLDDLMAGLQKLHIDTMVVTDISRDGALAGINDDLYRQLAGSGLKLVASGGVTTVEDVTTLKTMGLYGAIVGRAYYDGTFDLRDGIARAGQ